MRGWMWAVGAAMLAVGCGEGEGEGGPGVDAVMALSGDTAKGAEVYVGHCASCHGVDGSGGSGPSLTGEAEDPTEIAAVVVNGDGEMPGFAGALSDQDMADVVAYVEIVLQSGAGSDGD